MCLKLFLLFSFPLRKKKPFHFPSSHSNRIERIKDEWKNIYNIRSITRRKALHPDRFSQKVYWHAVDCSIQPTAKPHTTLSAPFRSHRSRRVKSLFYVNFLSCKLLHEVGWIFFLNTIHTKVCAWCYTRDWNNFILSCTHWGFLVIRRRSFFAWTPQKILNVTLCWWGALFLSSSWKSLCPLTPAAVTTTQTCVSLAKIFRK